MTRANHDSLVAAVEHSELRGLIARDAAFRELLSALDEGFCVVEMVVDEDGKDVDYRFLESNIAFMRQTGLSDPRGRTAREVLPGLDQHWVESYGRVARTGRAERFQNGAEALNKWFDVYAFPLPRNGSVRHPVGILFTDVTGDRLAERERDRLVRDLEVERSRLAFIFQHAPAFLAVLRGPDLVFELVNDAYCQLVGHRTLIGLPLWDALPDVQGQGFELLLHQVMTTGEPYIGREVPVSIERTPGARSELRFVDLVYMPLVEGDGETTGVIAHGTDVTAQVQARQDAERLFAATQRAAARSATLLDLSDRLRDLRNPAEIAAATTEIIGRSLGASYAGYGVVDHEPTTFAITGEWFANKADVRSEQRTRSNAWPYLVDVLRRGDSFVVANSANDERMQGCPSDHGLRKAGACAYLPVSHSAAHEGSAINVFAVHFNDARHLTTEDLSFIRDGIDRAWAATERARLLDAERAARREAEAASRSKSEFLAVMSHELRTPLNAIGGYTELIELGIRGPVTAEQRADLHRIQHSQRHLLGLINQVLNYARVETGALVYEVTDVPIGDALSSAEALILPQIRAKGLMYVLGACDPDLTLRADRDKLQQILLNLLTNAIKFTDRGGTIRVDCQGKRETIEISVADTGVGIAEEKRATVFDPFVQVDQRLTRPHDGVGLGLAISRELARGMGGDLRVQSRLGVGSTFTLSLPSSP